MIFEILRLPRLLCLALSILFFVGTAMSQSTDNESSIFAFTDLDCTIRPRPRQPGTPDGACHKIATVNATALTVARLGFGCTISAYSDENCTEDPTAIRENQCTSINTPFLSFSVDNCTPNPPTASVSTRIRTLSTSTTRSPQSTGSSRPTDPSNTDPDPSNIDSDPSNIDSDPPLSTSTSPPSSNSGLSSGAKAGIAVGVTVVALLIAGLIIRHFFFGRRPATPPVAPDHTATDPTDPEKKRFWPFSRRRPSHTFPPPPAELGGSYTDQETAQTEQLMQAPTVYELSGAQYGELPTGRGVDDAK